MCTTEAFVRPLLLVCCLYAVSEASSFETQLISAGSNVTYSCYPHSSSIHWVYHESKYSKNTFYIDLDNPSKTHLREMYDQVLSVTSNGSTVLNLTLLGVTSKHAGVYLCEEFWNEDLITAQDVGVFVSEPKCVLSTLSTNDNNALLLIECSVNYTGNWLPVFTCQPDPYRTRLSGESFNRTLSVVYDHSFNVTHQWNLTNNAACELQFNRTKMSDAAFLPPQYKNQWHFTIEPLTTAGLNNASNGININDSKGRLNDELVVEVNKSGNGYTVVMVLTAVMFVAMVISLVICTMTLKNKFELQSECFQFCDRYHEDQWSNRRVKKAGSSATAEKRPTINSALSVTSPDAVYAELAQKTRATIRTHRPFHQLNNQQHAVYADIDHVLGAQLNKTLSNTSMTSRPTRPIQ